MVKIMRIIVRAFVAFAFISSGIMKITDRINPKVHQRMVTEFKVFAKVHPFAVFFGYVPDPTMFRLSTGAMEIAGAIFLLLGNTKAQILSSFLLMTIMVGALFTHYMMGHVFGQCVPALVLFILLLTHLFRIIRDPPKDAKKSE